MNHAFFSYTVVFLLTSSSLAAGQIRLAGRGSTRCSGRVEVYHAGTWGTVCDDSWDLNDATVVCRQLSCGRALGAPGAANFGVGTGKIWLDDVQCSGRESSLTLCRHNGFGTQDCGHGEDASVICSGSEVRLIGSILCSGRVEVYHEGTWGTVCDDNWDSVDAAVVCKQLNCGRALSATSKAVFGKGSDPIWLDDVSCSGRESSLIQCQHKGFGKHDCSHGEDAGVICSEAVLPTPTISLSSASEVTWGDDVSITCSVAAELPGGTFILTKTSHSFREDRSSDSKSASFIIRNVNFDHDGSYQCQYKKIISDQTLTSSLSDPVTLRVTVSFLKPSISINSAGEVDWGQETQITCIISTHILGGIFVLTNIQRSFMETQTSSINSVTFSIPKADFYNDGLYQCEYKIKGPRQDFISPSSDQVRLSVRMQRPNISLTSLNAGLVWGPEGAEVTRGYSFSITCSINSEYPRGDFIFIFSGSNVTETRPAVNNSVSFNFPVAEYKHQGNYSCVYEVTHSTQIFLSDEATPIRVVIKSSLLLPVFSLSGGILLLLLLVLLVVCLVRRGRRRTKELIIFSQHQVTITESNPYFAVDDDEEDYENVYREFTVKPTEEVEEEEENNDYEECDEPKKEEGEDEESNESENDYENISVADFTMKPTEEMEEEERDHIEEGDEEFNEEEEEDEEISDDENDYENISVADFIMTPTEEMEEEERDHNEEFNEEEEEDEESSDDENDYMNIETDFTMKLPEEENYDDDYEDITI